MNKKKTDSKGRILRTGESQLKDGRYRYNYTDMYGVQRDRYSWRLTSSDRVPEGKRDCIPLREIEQQIAYKVGLGLKPNGGGYTVYQLCKRYVDLKVGMTASTQAGYKTTLKLLEKHPFGEKRIDKVTESDAKYFLIELQQKYGKSGNTVRNRRGVIKPAFDQAVRDDLIRKNPFDFQLKGLLVDDSVKKIALSKADEKRYLEFIQTDNTYKKYYDGMVILFHTGLRIGEFCGLTLSDIDFKEKRIDVNHCMHYKEGKRYIKEDGVKKAKTKTPAGIRIIPMDQETCERMKHLIEMRKKPASEPVIDGYSGFVILNKNGDPATPNEWEHHVKASIEKYNRIYKNPLPMFTPHTARYTYCTKMALNGMNPKLLQYLMGHDDITMTLQYYTHVTFEDAREEFERIIREGNGVRKKK